jgi:peptide/nickel transport system substrate-binding protein
MAHSVLSSFSSPFPARASARGIRGHGRSALAGICLVCVVLLALAGCGGGGSTTGGSTPVTGGTLNVGIDSDLKTLDPILSSALVERQILLNIYDTLFTVDANNVIQPGLATSSTYNSPTQLVLTLRSGVQFQDGTPFNADAVVFNINRILHASSSPRKSEISTVKSVTAVDSTHVQFNLSKAFSPLLATLSDRSGMMLSPTAAQAATASDIANNPQKMGSGPFQLKEWVKNDHISIVRNPTYWQKDSAGRTLPYLDGVTYKPITNGSTRFTNLQTGAVEAINAISPTDIQTAQNDSNLVYKQIPGLSFFGIMLNVKQAPLNDAHVRRAIAYAINPQEIVSSVLLNTGVVAHGPIPPASWAYSASIAPFSHDVDKAKAELAQASGGSSPTFTMLIVGGDPTGAQEAQFIQSELAPAGITVNIKPETFPTLLTDTDPTNPHFQAAVLGWSGRPDPDGNMFSWFHTSGGNNSMQYSNAQVDAALDDARVQSDQGKRAADYQQAEQQILQDSSYIFINHGVSIQATSKKVHNYLLLPLGIMFFGQVYLS